MTYKSRALLKCLTLGVLAVFASAEPLQAASMAGFGPSFAPPVQAFPRDPSAIEIPFEHVTVKEIFKGAGDKIVIHIQDAHSNLSGQESLAGALDEFMKRYDAPLVLVEGADRDVSLTKLREKLSAETWKTAAKRFLYDGAISGEEYLNLTSAHPMKIVGVEHSYLYDENLKAYAQLAKKREDTVAYLRRVRVSVERLKGRLYPRGITDYERMKTGSLDARDFESEWKRLQQLAASYGLQPPAEFDEIAALKEVQNIESSVDFDRANADQSAIFKKLSEAGVPLERFTQSRSRVKNLQASQHMMVRGVIAEAARAGIQTADFKDFMKYAGYLEAFSRLNLDKLMLEMEAYEEGVYSAALTASDARKLRGIDRFLVLLENAYAIRMTSKQFEAYRANVEDFATPAWQAFLNEKLIGFGYFEDIVPYKPLLEEAREPLESFYRLVHQRDFAFVENTLRIMDVEKQAAAFLIVGGYHTAHLTELLREKNISYVVLTPVVTFETDRAQYERVLLSSLEDPELSGGKSKPLAAAPAKSDIRSKSALVAPGARFAAYLSNASLAEAAKAVIDARLSEPVNPVLDSFVSGQAEVAPAAPGARIVVSVEDGIGDLDARLEDYRFDHPSEGWVADSLNLLRDAMSAPISERYKTLLLVTSALDKASDEAMDEPDGEEDARVLSELWLAAMQMTLYTDLTISSDMRGNLAEDLPSVAMNPEQREALRALYDLERAIPRSPQTKPIREALLPDVSAEPGTIMARLLMYPLGVRMDDAYSGEFFREAFDQRIGRPFAALAERIRQGSYPQEVVRTLNAAEGALGGFRGTLKFTGNAHLAYSLLEDAEYLLREYYSLDENVMKSRERYIEPAKKLLNGFLGNAAISGTTQEISRPSYATRLSLIGRRLEGLRKTIRTSESIKMKDKARFLGKAGLVTRAESAILNMTPGARAKTPARGFDFERYFPRRVAHLLERGAQRLGYGPNYETMSADQMEEMSRLFARNTPVRVVVESIQDGVIRIDKNEIRGKLIRFERLDENTFRIEVQNNAVRTVVKIHPDVKGGRMILIEEDRDATLDQDVPLKVLAAERLVTKIAQESVYGFILNDFRHDESRAVARELYAAVNGFMDGLPPDQVAAVLSYAPPERVSFDSSFRHTVQVAGTERSVEWVYVPAGIMDDFWRYLATEKASVMTKLAFLVQPDFQTIFHLDSRFRLRLMNAVDAYFSEYPQQFSDETVANFIDWVSQVRVKEAVGDEQTERYRGVQALKDRFGRVEARVLRFFDSPEGYLTAYNRELLQKSFFGTLTFNRAGDDFSDAHHALRVSKADGPWRYFQGFVSNIVGNAPRDIEIFLRQRGASRIDTILRLTVRAIRFELGSVQVRQAIAGRTRFAETRLALNRARRTVAGLFSRDPSVRLNAFLMTMNTRDAITLLYGEMRKFPTSEWSSRSEPRAAIRLLEAAGIDVIHDYAKLRDGIDLGAGRGKSLAQFMRDRVLLAEKKSQPAAAADDEDDRASVRGARASATFESGSLSDPAGPSSVIMQAAVSYEEFWEPQTGTWYRAGIFGLNDAPEAVRKAAREAAANALYASRGNPIDVSVLFFPDASDGAGLYEIRIRQSGISETDWEKILATRRGFESGGAGYLENTAVRAEENLIRQQGAGFASLGALMKDFPVRMNFQKDGDSLEAVLRVSIPSGARVLTRKSPSTRVKKAPTIDELSWMIRGSFYGPSFKEDAAIAMIRRYVGKEGVAAQERHQTLQRFSYSQIGNQLVARLIVDALQNAGDLDRYFENPPVAMNYTWEKKIYELFQNRGLRYKTVEQMIDIIRSAADEALPEELAEIVKSRLVPRALRWAGLRQEDGEWKGNKKRFASKVSELLSKATEEPTPQGVENVLQKSISDDEIALAERMRALDAEKIIQEEADRLIKEGKYAFITHVTVFGSATRAEELTPDSDADVVLNVASGWTGERGSDPAKDFSADLAAAIEKRGLPIQASAHILRNGENMDFTPEEPWSGARASQDDGFLDEPLDGFRPVTMGELREGGAFLPLAANAVKAEEFFAGVPGARTFGRFRKAVALEAMASNGSTSLEGEYEPLYSPEDLAGTRETVTGVRVADVDIESILADKELAKLGPETRRMLRSLAESVRLGRAPGGIRLYLDDFAPPGAGADDASFRMSVAQAVPLAGALERIGFRIEIGGSEAFVDYAKNAGMERYLQKISGRLTLVASPGTLASGRLGEGQSPLPIVRPAPNAAEFDVLNLPGIFYQAAELSMMREGDDPSDDLVRYTAQKTNAGSSGYAAIRGSYRDLAAGATGETLAAAVARVSLPKLLSAGISNLIDMMQKAARWISSAA